MRAMKITDIETFVVSTGFRPPRPWLFCAVRTDAGVTGYSEIKDGHMTIPTGSGWGTELNEKAARAHAWEG
jgi:L-alanine-DL-glutamate epimerase-like enolase superfamily enzyme